MYWEIEFYNEVVEANVKNWSDAMMPKFLWLLNVIEKIGPDKLGSSYVKSLGQGLFKISVKGHHDTGCALFCISAEDKLIIILNAFVQTSPQSMIDEIQLARTRMNEIYSE